MKPTRILLGAAARDYDWVNDSVATLVFLAQSAGPNTIVNLRIEDSTYIDIGRNKLVQDAKEFDADYLFMLDSDVYLEDFSISVLSRFMNDTSFRNADVVTGIYVSALNGKPSLSIYDLVDGVYTPIMVWPLHERHILGTGGGFLMMNRAVINYVKGDERLFDRYPRLGEDISFSKRITEAGFKILVDPAIQLGHKKSGGFNRATWEARKQ